MSKTLRRRSLPLLLVLGLLLAACENTPGLRASASAPEAAQADQPRLTRFTDIPIPAGAKMNVTRSLILGPMEGWVGRLVFNAAAGTQTLFQFYTREMPRFDWQEISRVRAQVSILTYTRGARTATVQISSTTLGGSVVSVTMCALDPAQGADDGARGPRSASALPLTEFPRGRHWICYEGDAASLCVRPPRSLPACPWPLNHRLPPPRGPITATLTHRRAVRPSVSSG